MSPRKAAVAAPGEQWTVAGAEAGLRLDKFLAAVDRLTSRGRAFTALERGKVFVNGVEVGKADAARRLAIGDAVRVWMDRPGSSKPATSGGKIRDLHVIYEDEALIVVNKPAGLLAVPLERRAEAPSVYDQIEAHFRSRGKRRPFVVHRIDRDTSGLVVFAKNGGAQDRLKQQFKRREPERVYLAVVYGEPSPPQGTWHDTLVWDQKALIQKETHPDDPRGKEAIADYRVLESFGGASLIEVRLRTGKRNQIRLQARLRGHTLVGEERYVFGPQQLRPIDFGRQALHAARLEFLHPDDGRPLEFEAPLPADLEGLIARLRRQR
jgi:23S rRNA pseudouridine1911/1915/1917 synthase